MGLSTPLGMVKPTPLIASLGIDAVLGIQPPMSPEKLGKLPLNSNTGGPGRVPRASPTPGLSNPSSCIPTLGNFPNLQVSDFPEISSSPVTSFSTNFQGNSASSSLNLPANFHFDVSTISAL